MPYEKVCLMVAMVITVIMSVILSGNIAKDAKVAVIDLDNSIKLQYPVEYNGSIRGQAGNVYLTLKEVFGPPTSTSNGPIVKIKMKKDK